MAKEDLVAVLLRGYESKEFDYKEGQDWDYADKKARCELVKDILAMSNTLGGYLVLGVSQVSGGFQFDGMSDGECKSFDSTKINGFVQNYADPPINTTVRKVTHAGKNFIIIEIPRFADTPHLCQKDFPGVLTDRALYVRTDNNESAPIKTSADFRAVIEQAVRNRSDTLLSSMRSILISGSSALSLAQVEEDPYTNEITSARQEFKKLNPLPNKNYEYFLECTFGPEQYVPNRFKVDRLRTSAFDATVDYTGWPFLFIHHNRPDVLGVFERGIQTHIYDNGKTFGSVLLDFWRFYESGMFFKKEMPFFATQKPDAAVFTDITQFCAEAIDCAVRLYRNILGEDEIVFIDITVCGTMGRSMVNHPAAGPLFGNYIAQVPFITVRQKHSLAEWRAGLEDHAVEMIRDVQLRFNWFTPGDDLARQRIKRLFARTL